MASCYLFTSTKSKYHTRLVNISRQLEQLQFQVKVVCLDTSESRERASRGKFFQVKMIPCLVVMTPDGDIRQFIGLSKIQSWIQHIIMMQNHVIDQQQEKTKSSRPRPFQRPPSQSASGMYSPGPDSVDTQELDDYPPDPNEYPSEHERVHVNVDERGQLGTLKSSSQQHTMSAKEIAAEMESERNEYEKSIPQVHRT